jgi:hypothetical protein
MTEIQSQLPNLTYDVIFNKESSTFEIWQYNNDFNTKALLQSYSLELITQLLKENFVNALLLLGATVKQVPEVPVSGGAIESLMNQIMEEDKELLEELAKH